MNMLALFLLLRLLFVAFWLCTSLYCLFCFVPFTFIQVIQGNLVSFIAPFGRLHQYFFWIPFAGVFVTLHGENRGRAGNALTLTFLAAMGLAGVALFFRPVLPSLQNDSASLVWSQVALLPIVWLAAIDFCSAPDGVRWESADTVADDTRALVSSFAAATFVWLVFSVLSVLRYGADASPVATAAALGASLVAHLLGGAALFAAIMLARSAATVLPRAALVEFVSSAVLLTVGLAAVLRGLVFAGISFGGAPSWIAALTLAGAMVLALSGLAISFLDPDGERVTNGLALLLRPLAPSGVGSTTSLAARLAAAAIAGWAMVMGAGIMDWNFLLQKLAVLAVWLFAFTAVYLARWPGRSEASRPILRTAALLATPVLVLILHRSVDAFAAPQAFDQHADREVAYRLLYDALTPAKAASVDTDLFPYLQRRTNIPRAIRIEPTDVAFVPRLGGVAARKPHIFLFVIDSLRRDYVAPYNSKVTFTPSIARFAAESTVFTNAFTHYGATGLSEPSIWVGGLLPHQQYVTPFAPLNALEKLLDAEGYRRFVSVDTILAATLKDSPLLTRIDERVATKDLDLCRSLGELSTAVSGASAPIFAYTQPQNIHISTIAREGGRAADEGDYDGFYAPYASRLRRVDACFGEFVDRLKATPLYQDSVIIVTSDHGDSLGESERWGHAYTLFPEIVRIPLIVHLPDWLKNGLDADPNAVAFSTDITPTLYALLGYQPVRPNEFFGRPLWAKAGNRQAPAPAQLMASSYGPVYGLLQNEGRSLYLIDGVNYREYFYDLTSGPAGTRQTLDDKQRASMQAQVRQKVDALYKFYGVRGLE